MRAFYILPALALLGACTVAPVTGSDPTGGRSFCGSPSDPICRFLNAPVALLNQRVELPKRAYPFFPIREPLQFIDASDRTWVAPRGTLTDGASVPPIFVSIVGSPNSREFVNAAAMHDAFCGVGNEGLSTFHSRSWEQTHRMFYEALRVGGTDEIRAKVMFAAVYLGGPRWAAGDRTYDAAAAEAAMETVSTQGRAPEARSRGLTDRALTRASTARMRQLMRQTKAWIERTNPSIARIEMYLSAEEKSVVEALERAQVRGNPESDRIGGAEPDSPAAPAPEAPSAPTPTPDAPSAPGPSAPAPDQPAPDGPAPQQPATPEVPTGPTPDRAAQENPPSPADGMSYGDYYNEDYYRPESGPTQSYSPQSDMPEK